MKKIFNFTDTFKNLFNINLIYANPAVVSSMMKKEKYRYNSEEMLKSLRTKTMIFTPVFILVIYTLIFIPFDFSKFPYLFDLSVSFFIVLNLLQTFTYFYNVFYESRDVESYMPLPIDEEDVFKSKLLVVAISTLQLLIPVISMYLIYYIKSGMYFEAIAFSIFDFILSLGVVMAVNMIFIQFLAKSSVLSKLRNKLVTIISLVAMIMNVGFVMLFQSYSFNLSEKAVKGGPKIYGPLTSLYRNNILHFIFILVGLLCLYGAYRFIMKNVNGNFYSYLRILQSSNKTGNKKKNNKKAKTENGESLVDDSSNDINAFYRKEKLSSILFRYNKALIGDNKVINQVLMGAVLPIVMLIPMLINISNTSFDLKSDINQFLLISMLALGLGILSNINAVSLPSIIVSLDRENFDYIRSLPIDIKSYIINKYIISAGVNVVLPLLALLGVNIFFGIRLEYMLISMFIFAIVSFALATNWIMFDYKNVSKDWQNVSDLASRVNRSFSMLLTFVITFIMLIFAVILYFIAEAGLQVFAIGTLLLIIAIIISVSTYRFRNFLKKLSY